MNNHCRFFVNLIYRLFLLAPFYETTPESLSLRVQEALGNLSPE